MMLPSNRSRLALASLWILSMLLGAHTLRSIQSLEVRSARNAAAEHAGARLALSLAALHRLQPDALPRLDRLEQDPLAPSAREEIGAWRAQRTRLLRDGAEAARKLPRLLDPAESSPWIEKLPRQWNEFETDAARLDALYAQHLAAASAGDDATARHSLLNLRVREKSFARLLAALQRSSAHESERLTGTTITADARAQRALVQRAALALGLWLIATGLGIALVLPRLRALGPDLLRDAAGLSAPPSRLQRRLATLAALGSAGLSARFAASKREWLLSLGNDGWVHFAYIRRSLEQGLFPGDAFYAGLATPPYYSLSHPLYALVCALGGEAIHTTWIASSAPLAAIAVLATFGAVRALSQDERIAAGACAVVLWVGIPEFSWGMPGPFALALIPNALAFLGFVKAEREGLERYAVAAGICSGLAFDLHPLGGAIGGLSIALLALASGRSLRRLLLCGGVALLVAAPWIAHLVLRWAARDDYSAGVFHYFPEAVAHAFGPFTWRAQTFSQITGGLPPGLKGLALLGLARCLLRVVRRDASLCERYALVASAVTATLLLSPAYELLLRFGGVWARRIAIALPWPLLIGLGVAVCFDSVRRLPRLGPALALALLAGVIGGTLPALRGYEALLAGLLDPQIRPGGPLGDWRMESALARSGSLPRVVLSDPETSYALPYLIGAYVVKLPSEHGSHLVDDRDRESAVERFYAPGTDDAELRRILERYRVDAVAVRQGAWRPEDSRRLAERLRAHPDFEAAGCCAELEFFRYRPAPR